MGLEEPGAGDAKRRSDPARVYVAEVVALYARLRTPKAPGPKAVKARLDAILSYWGEKTLSDVRTSECEGYVAARTKQPVKSYTNSTPRLVSTEGARRELEDLSAASGLWDDEHHLSGRPKVTLPPKAESPRDALTRSQAAALLWAALGWRKGSDGKWKRLGASALANRAHLCRLILIDLYTGTRPGVIPKLLWEESPTQAWADLVAGVIYRRGKLEREQRTKRRRLVKVPARLLAHMRRWRRLDEKASRLAARNAERAGEKPPAPLVTVLHHGGAPISGKIRRGFARCVADDQLDSDITPHWMRHTCATWLVEAGVETWEAAAYAGMTVLTLEKCYGHHRPDDQANARTALAGRRL